MSDSTPHDTSHGSSHGSTAGAGAAGDPKQRPARDTAKERAPSSSSAAPIAWLALILVLVLAAAGFYQTLNLQQRETALLQRIQSIESVSVQDDTGFAQMRDNLERKIELELEGIKARQERADGDQQRALGRLDSLANDAAGNTKRELGAQLTALQEALKAQQETLREQQRRISDLSMEDRESWLLAEAQYLLRLANQRLIMTGDAASAQALLRSADTILRELGDTDLLPLRAAVAADLAALRAVPTLDTQGLYLRLDALIRQTDALVLFKLPPREAKPPPAPAEDWKSRLTQGYESALAKLAEYIVVRRRDVPVEALMDPQYEGLVRQNMRMLLEQAQVAMLSGNEVLFRQSLERAAGWVNEFFKSDELVAQAMADELRRIRDERISVDLPALDGSLLALDSVMQARLARAEN